VGQGANLFCFVCELRPYSRLGHCDGRKRRTNSPSRGVKVLAGRPDRQGDLLDLRGKGRDAGEGDVKQAVIDLVRQDDDLVLEAEVGDSLQLVAREDLADGVVLGVLVLSRTEGEKGHTWRVEDQHLGLGCDGALELVKVDGPLACREGLDGAFFGRVHGHVDDLAAGHLDVADVPTGGEHLFQRDWQ